MDAFGIGYAVIGAARVYFNSARRSGRTTALMSSIKDGDRVVCVTERQANHLRQLFKDYGVEATAIVVPPERPERLFQVTPSTGRTIFDHAWLEQYYLRCLQETASLIDHWQAESSGHGHKHVQTKLAAQEITKWSAHP
jgi:hypothetical protein